MEAFVRGFGKFTERSVRFSAGAQLFVGSNEAGKSTLQRFLLAMLFGLKREDRKRRDYLPEYDLYKPWSGAVYGGRLSYALSDGRRYEVQRVFERQDEEVRLFDAISGREVTAEFPLDHRKERPFMQSQLQLSRQLFEATTAMGQLAGRPSEDGTGALRERIQGLLDSGDENLSARAALVRLEQLRDRFGSERTPTRGLGQLQRRRRELQTELDEARARHAEILELHARIGAVAADYRRYERAWEERRRTELIQERQQLGKRLQRVEKLDGEIEQLTARLASYADVVELDVAAHSKAREHTAALSALTVEIQGRREEIEALQASLEEWRRVEVRLQRALGGLDPAGARLLEQRAERLRESIGRLREARQREEEERRRNRAIVEALQRHRGKDWTQDGFMGQLAATRALLASADVSGHNEAVRSSRRDSKRQQWRVAWQGLLILGGGAGLAAWWWELLRLLPAGPWLPLGAAAVAVLLFFLWSLRGVVRMRDRARAAALQAEHATARLREAQEWLDAALRRNGVQGAEDLESARREYENLRAQAERTSAASNRERLDSEASLAELADALHTQVQRCDLVALAALRAEPDAAAQGLPHFEEPARLEGGDEKEPAELRRLGEDLRRLPALRHACAWLERVRLECDARRRRLELERQALEQRQSRASQVQEEFAALLRRNGARDLADFARRVGRHQERESLLALLRPLQREREGVLGGETPDSMRGRLRQIESTSTQAGLFETPSSGFEGGLLADLLTQPLESLGRRKDALAGERAQLGERLAGRESEGRLPAEIELEVQEVEGRIEAERRRLAALQLAMETLENVATKRHREAAPRMNERVGQLFARLSRGEHKEVRLDEDLTPRVRMDGEGYCGAESLSGGAADQLYFALRVTAGEQLARAGEFLPLLLDDPFVQYDPERLQAGLDLVAQLAREHQVLFFTCETEQAEGLGTRLRAAGVEHGIERL